MGSFCPPKCRWSICIFHSDWKEKLKYPSENRFQVGLQNNKWSTISINLPHIEKSSNFPLINSGKNRTADVSLRILFLPMISPGQKQPSWRKVNFYADWCPHCRSQGSPGNGCWVSSGFAVRFLKGCLFHPFPIKCLPKAARIFFFLELGVVRLLSFWDSSFCSYFHISHGVFWAASSCQPRC